MLVMHMETKLLLAVRQRRCNTGNLPLAFSPQKACRMHDMAFAVRGTLHTTQGSHGTHEFYTERAHITKQLFLNGGFNAVMLESDFPDAFKVRHAWLLMHGRCWSGRKMTAPCSACKVAASI